jgi:multidrug resistance efflux pump
MTQLNSGGSDRRITYENTRLTLADAIRNAKLSLEQSDSGYKNALALKDATLTQLIATKKNAEISLEQARRDYAKLRIIAPVDGVIGKVIGSVGQSVNIGSPVAEFTSRLPQIILDIDSGLAGSLIIGDTVTVRVDAVTLSGVVSAVSTVSNANLLSTVRISIPT